MAFDAFLKIDGIPGESQDAKHKGEIDVLSFQWGVAQPTAGRTGRPTGRADVHDLTITKFLDKASPLLFASACHGDHISTAVFTLRKAGGNPIDFYKVTLTDILISSVSPSGTAGGEVTAPLEEVSLNFGRVEITFTPQDATGSPGAPVTTTCSSHR
jgi:type VI secretion system secreted protein Hcp